MYPKVQQLFFIIYVLIFKRKCLFDITFVMVTHECVLSSMGNFPRCFAKKLIFLGRDTRLIPKKSSCVACHELAGTRSLFTNKSFCRISSFNVVNSSTSQLALRKRPVAQSAFPEASQTIKPAGSSGVSVRWE